MQFLEQQKFKAVQQFPLASGSGMPAQDRLDGVPSGQAEYLAERDRAVWFNRRITGASPDSLTMLEQLYLALLKQQGIVAAGHDGESYEDVLADINAGRINMLPPFVGVLLLWLACGLQVVLAFLQSSHFNAPPTYDWAFWSSVAINATVAVVVPLLAWRNLKQQRQQLRELAARLPGSGLIAMLAAGPETVEGIKAEVPRVYRPLYFAVDPRSWADVAKVMRSNLDWLLSPPKVYVRSEWNYILVLIGICLLVLTGIISLFVALAGMSYPLSPTGEFMSRLSQVLVNNLQTLNISIWVGLGPAASRSVIYRRLLLPYLRSHIDAEEPSDSGRSE